MAIHARRPAIGKRPIEHVDRGARPASGCLDPDFCRSIGVARTSPAAPVAILTAADLASLPPAPLDDALKTTPGFSLFRRTTSRSSNPTTQGAGLRGLSASGASRALVLADGTPLNDPVRRLGVLEPHPGRGHRSRRSRERRRQRPLRRRCARRRRAGADAPARAAGGARRSRRRESFDRPPVALCRRRARSAGAGPWPAKSFRPTATCWCRSPTAGSVDTPANSRYTSGRVEAGYSTSPAFTRRHCRRRIRRASRQRHAGPDQQHRHSADQRLDRRERRKAARGGSAVRPAIRATTRRFRRLPPTATQRR